MKYDDTAIKTPASEPKEGDLYAVVHTFGKTFELKYGYYDDMDRSGPPDVIYPDFIEDGAAAVAFIKNNRDKYGIGDKLYVGGSSAGGYLSMMLCFDKKYLAKVGLDNSYISGYFHDAGQPTAHYNVLKYKGIDHRRIIVDETAPLYYVGLEDKYPPMRFIVSDNDIKDRYEQTMLMLSSLSHFKYSGFDHVVMKGSHCEYCGKFDENGVSVLGKVIYDFISKVQE